MFVYGTLRPGGDLAHLLADAVIDTIDGCTVPGTLHLHPYTLGGVDYPVYRYRPDAGERTVGTLYRVNDTHDFRYTLVMELGAGYDARWVHVAGPDGEQVTADGTALTFCWPDYEPVGPRIDGDDWHNVQLPRPTKGTCDTCGEFSMNAAVWGYCPTCGEELPK